MNIYIVVLLTTIIDYRSNVENVVQKRVGCNDELVGSIEGLVRDKCPVLASRLSYSRYCCTTQDDSIIVICFIITAGT